MSRNSADDNQNLAPWLRGVPLPPRPPGADAPPAQEPQWTDTPAAAGPAESDQMPDWLKDLGATAATEPSTAQPELPAWLGSSDSAPANAPPSGGAGFPDWLQDEPQLQPPASQESALPGWLGGAPGEASTEPPASAEALPAWLTDLTADEPHAAAPSAQSGAEPERQGAETPSAPAADELEIPGWPPDISSEEIQRVMQGEDEEITLEPFSFDAAPESARTEPAADVPSWLAGISAETADQADSAPSWLDSLSAEPAGAQDVSASTPDLPLWIQDLGAAPATESAPVAGESAAEEPAIVPPVSEPPAGVPAWLQDEAQAQPPAVLPSWLQAETGAAAQPAEDLPAWPEAEPAPPASTGDVPTWLTERAEVQLDARSSAPPAEDLPAWLRADVAPPSATPDTTPAGELPSWLNAAVSSTPPDTMPASPSETAPSIPLSPSEDLPAWLRDDVATPPPAADDLPNWLRTGAPAGPPASPPGAEPPAREDLPDWLQTGAPAGPPASPPRAEPPPPAADDLPNWLRTGAPAGPPASPPGAEPPGAAPRPADELPPWLRDETGQPLPTAGAPGDANLPAWLRGADDTTALSQAPAAAAPDRQPPQPPTLPTRPVPTNLDWFGEDQEPSVAGRAPAGESEFFGGAELPAWLRKVEVEPGPEIRPADARSLDWLTKLGAQEEETAAVVTPTTLPRRPLPSHTPAQIQALALLERLAAEPYPELAPLAAPAVPSIWQRIGLERLLYVVLLIALLAALAMPALAASLEAPPTGPGANDLFRQVDPLTDKDVVLVGYEWDARRISELKPLEQAVIGQLIQKHVKLVLVSTDPQGTLLLFDLRDQLKAAGYQEGGQDYILLGYKPGGELALRSLAQDLQGSLRVDFQGNDATKGVLAGGMTTGKPLTALNDFSMIFVLADDASDVQGWVEQVRRAVPRTPFAFLLPAEAAPIAQPYLQLSRSSEQSPIYHLSGKQGALAYEQLRSAEFAPAEVAREASQQRLGILVFVVLLAIGGVVVLVSGALRRGKAA